MELSRRAWELQGGSHFKPIGSLHLSLSLFRFRLPSFLPFASLRSPPYPSMASTFITLARPFSSHKPHTPSPSKRLLGLFDLYFWNFLSFSPFFNFILWVILYMVHEQDFAVVHWKSTQSPRSGNPQRFVFFFFGLQVMVFCNLILFYMLIAIGSCRLFHKLIESWFVCRTYLRYGCCCFCFYYKIWSFSIEVLSVCRDCWLIIGDVRVLG